MPSRPPAIGRQTFAMIKRPPPRPIPPRRYRDYHGTKTGRTYDRAPRNFGMLEGPKQLK